MAKNGTTPVADAGLARVIRDALGGPVLATLAAVIVATAAFSAAWWTFGDVRSQLDAEALRHGPVLGQMIEAMETSAFTAIMGIGAMAVLGVLVTAVLWAAFSSRGLPLDKKAVGRLAVLPVLILIIAVTSIETALVTDGWGASAEVIVSAALGAGGGAIFGGLGAMSMTTHAIGVLRNSGPIERYHRSLIHALYGEESRDRFLSSQAVALYHSGLTPEQAASLIRAGLSPERAAVAGPEAAATPAVSDGWL